MHLSLLRKNVNCRKSSELSKWIQDDIFSLLYSAPFATTQVDDRFIFVFEVFEHGNQFYHDKTVSDVVANVNHPDLPFPLTATIIR